MVRRIAEPTSPTGLRRWLFRAPIWLYRAHLGRLLGGRFLLLTHTGRRTGLRRQVVLEVVGRVPGTGVVQVVSGFGRAAQWYRNILRQPEVTIQVGGRVSAATAVPLPPEESGRALARYARRHPRLARRLIRFCGYEVDGSKADYIEVGREHIPVVAIVARRALP